MTHNDAQIDAQTDTVIRLAWSDTASFEHIREVTGLREADVIKLMRRHLKPGSFRAWRKRVTGRGAKHRKRQALKDKQGLSDLTEA